MKEVYEQQCDSVAAKSILRRVVEIPQGQERLYCHDERSKSGVIVQILLDERNSAGPTVFNVLDADINTEFAQILSRRESDDWNSCTENPVDPCRDTRLAN